MILEGRTIKIISSVKENKKTLLGLTGSSEVRWRCPNISCSNCFIRKIIEERFELDYSDCNKLEHVLSVKEELLEAFNSILEHLDVKDGWKI